jgi:tRNA G37 N-methylase Trm5
MNYKEQLEKLERTKLAKALESTPLTPEQITNLRKVLYPILGVVAILASPEEINELRNQLQQKIER